MVLNLFAGAKTVKNILVSQGAPVCTYEQANKKLLFIIAFVQLLTGPLHGTGGTPVENN